jgi:hypothetical protein
MIDAKIQQGEMRGAALFPQKIKMQRPQVSLGLDGEHTRSMLTLAIQSERDIQKG